MRLTKRRFFYHITRELWGGAKTLKPRCADKANRPSEEPKLARICVSKSVSGCLSAISNDLFYASCFHVYRTFHRVQARYAWGVPDVRLTQERWLTCPTRFIRVGSISCRVLEQIRGHDRFHSECGDPDTLDMQQICLDRVIRPACLLLGWS